MAKLTSSTTPIANAVKLPRKPLNKEISDQDALWKEFFTQFFKECILLLHPKLWAAVDWSVPPEFLEQELINSLRGRFRIKGKKKLTDKFVKLRLKTGEDCFVFVHLEVQGELEDVFVKRLFTYRSLIFLRYDIENVTTIVLFTGDKPSEKHKKYFTECFGSNITFNFNFCAILEQNEAVLMKSNNPLAIAMLAGKYTAETKTDVQKRLFFKRKLFELAKKKGFSPEYLWDVLNFVYDYMVLPRKIDNEFKAAMPNFSPLKSSTMLMTKGRRTVGDMFFKSEHGKPIKEWVADTIAELTVKVTNEVTAKVEAEVTAKVEAEVTAKVEAEAEIERKKTIQAMLGEGFSVERIAHILDYDLAFVQKTAEELASK
jgi:hypothetical protein